MALLAADWCSENPGFSSYLISFKEISPILHPMKTPNITAQYLPSLIFPAYFT